MRVGVEFGFVMIRVFGNLWIEGMFRIHLVIAWHIICHVRGVQEVMT